MYEEERKKAREKAALYLQQYAFETLNDVRTDSLLRLAATLEFGEKLTREDLAPIQARLFQDLFRGQISPDPRFRATQIEGFLRVLTED